jgi:hypothetical protein
VTAAITTATIAIQFAHRTSLRLTSESHLPRARCRRSLLVLRNINVTRSIRTHYTARSEGMGRGNSELSWVGIGWLRQFTHNLNFRRSRFAFLRLPRRSMYQIAQRKMTKPPASRTTSVKVSPVIARTYRRHDRPSRVRSEFVAAPTLSLQARATIFHAQIYAVGWCSCFCRFRTVPVSSTCSAPD